MLFEIWIFSNGQSDGDDGYLVTVNQMVMTTDKQNKNTTDNMFRLKEDIYYLSVYLTVLVASHDTIDSSFITSTFIIIPSRNPIVYI